MGYCVNIVESTCKIPAKNKPEILAIWKALNAPENDNLKHGGSWSNGGKSESYFSWCEENYDKTMNSCEEILDMLGFETETDDETGDIYIENYDSKSGQEDLFFDRVKHLVVGKIVWNGEDDECWTWNFDSKTNKDTPLDFINSVKLMDKLFS